MEELKVIESELVPVYETDKGQKVVYGSELHTVLEVKSRFNDWIKNRLNDCDAAENKDFQTLTKNLVGGGKQTEYIIQLATAKEMAMLERNDKGKQVRRYFIKVEEEYKEIVQNGTTHNVKQLTITSRDIAVMTTSKNLHAKVIANIRDCIAELEEMGFHAREFFILDSYIGANKQENPQYICTERGCEYYSGKLEPDKRKVFIEEFTDRFERMRNVLEGKPVKKMPKAVRPADVQEKEPLIRLYKNNAWGILLADNEVYILNPGDVETLSRFISEMEKQNIGQIQCIVSAFLKSMKKSERLEEIASWGAKEKGQQQPLLPDKTAQKPKRTSSRDDNAPFITFEQAKNRYNMGFTKITQLAKESGALIRYGKSVRYDRVKMDAYLAKEYSE